MTEAGGGEKGSLVASHRGDIIPDENIVAASLLVDAVRTHRPEVPAVWRPGAAPPPAHATVCPSAKAGLGSLTLTPESGSREVLLS
jgi:hypothetical protein